MPSIKKIACRRILNSHVEFPNEFIPEFADGAVGVGGSPQGETISIYEDQRASISPETIIRAIEEDGILGREIDQAAFDAVLESKIKIKITIRTLPVYIPVFIFWPNRMSTFESLVQQMMVGM